MTMNYKYGYLPSGKATVKKDDAVAYWLVSKDETQNRFYIRVSAYRQMYNPLDMYGINQSYKSNDRTTGKPKFKFELVSQETFNNYVKFLKTKNPLWLRQAERIFKDK